MVIKSLSECPFMYAKYCAHESFFFKKESILCFGKLIRAISVPEKNQESKNNIMKTTIVE